MESDANTKQSCYNSVYRHGVDEKRRVQIPAKWRPAESGFEFTLILWPKYKEGPCVRVLPPPEVEKLMRKLEAMPDEDPNKVVLKRFIGSQSVQVSVDKGGRICLPEEMANTAGLKDEAVLVGLMNQFEIWSPERHKQISVSDAVMAQEAFKLMA